MLTVWNILADGGSIRVRTPLQQEALDRYNDAMIIKKTGWSAQDIACCPEDFYKDLITIINLKEIKDANRQKKKVPPR